MEEEAGVARGQGDEINVLHDVSINDAIETGGMLLTQDFPTSPDSSTATDSKKENLPALPQATIASTDDDDDGGSVNEISTQCEPAVVVVAESPPSTTSHATLKQNPEHSESPVPEPPVLAPALAIDQTALTSPPIAKDKDETADTSCDDEDESSSSEDDDDEPNDRNVLSLMDRRKRNMERNQAFLNRIGLAYGITSKRKRTLTKKSTAQDDDDDSTAVVVKKRRGMLLLPTPTAFNSSSNPIPATSQNSGFVESLLTTFPHRQPQIRKLSSLLTAAAAQSCPATAVASTCSETPIVHTIVHVPAPILVTGANGSGKTCILRAIVNGILQQQEQQHGSASKVVSAYTNCATLDVPSIDELVTSAFNQFQAAVERLSGDKNASTKLKRRKKKRLAGDASSRGLESSEAVERATPEACDNMADKAVENSAGPEKRASRHRSAARTTRRNKASETTAEAPTFKAAKTRVFSAGSEDMAVVSSETTWSTEQTAVWAFGRTLASLFEGRRHAGILVVDQAERLQSMSTNKGTGERNNFLSQLLFLPRVANINLTVIVVSNSLLLDHSRECLV
jgi:Cdc6-like AAA superfamily ATPase